MILLIWIFAVIELTKYRYMFRITANTSYEYLDTKTI